MFQGGDGQQCWTSRDGVDERPMELATLSQEGQTDTCFDGISNGGRSPMGEGQGRVGDKEMEVMRPDNLFQKVQL